MRVLLKVSILALIVGTVTAMTPGTLSAFPSWSVAPASPTGLAPGDVLDPVTGAPTGGGPQGAPVAGITAAALGLPAGANVDGLSYGDDLPVWGPPVNYEFSVAPGAVGAPWLPAAPPQNVATQTVAEGAVEGDIFVDVVGVAPGGPACAPGLNINMQLYDADGANVGLPLVVPGLGGMADPPAPPAGPPHDDIDAYEARDVSAVDYRVPLTPGAAPGSDGLPDGPIFFTVDAATAAGLPADPLGSGPITGADILVTDPSSPTGWVVYAPEGVLGLAPGDDIDALLVADSGMGGPGPAGVIPAPRAFGGFHPTDFVAYSLTPGSPSLGVSPLPAVCAVGAKFSGDMWAISPLFKGGAVVPWLAGEDIGLCSPRVLGCPAAADNLDAIDIAWAVDADADGLPDGVEGGLCAGAVAGLADTDGDGLLDGLEAVLGANPAGPCLAGGGFPDPALADSDGDGMDDAWELAYWLPMCPSANTSIADPAMDVDPAGTGFPGPDGLGQLGEYMQGTSPCDADSDGDGYEDLAPTAHQGPSNTSIPNDNCPAVANGAQTNSDGNFTDLTPPRTFDDVTLPMSDAMGDACDTDDDNDGESDAAEAAGCGFGATMSAVADTDGDRVIDGAECLSGTNPNSSASFPAVATCHANVDVDVDGVRDTREFCFYGTSSGSVNSDGDTLDDQCEIASVDNDTSVTVLDLQRVAQHFASSGLGLPYLANMDVDKDGAITVLDLQYVAGRFLPCP